MPPSTALVVFPFSAAVLFAVAALALKRSSQLGAGVWQTAFVANVVGAFCYSFVWLLGGPPVAMELLWQPALIALCLFCGMALQLVALSRGDVSVAVPVMGLKVLIVAFMTPWLIGESVRPGLWVSGLFSVIGVTFLNWKVGGVSTRSVTPALVAGGAASVCFALFDILVQKWGPTWGAGRLLPLVFGMNALFSLACIPGFHTPLRSLSRQAWRWLLTAGLVLGMQSILFVGCVAIYGQATAANIIYSARGLISVLLIWTIGHWFSNAERSLGSRALGCRLVGAAFMLAAIMLAVMRVG